MFDKIKELFAARKFGDAAILIRQGLNENYIAMTSGGRNVMLAHCLLLAADWKIISGLLPRRTNFFMTSGWLNSVLSGRPINETGEPLPWFTYPAIDFLDGRMNADWNVFEWGSGNSTLWWSRRVKTVHAVEDNRQWFDICNNTPSSNVNMILAESRTEYVESIRLSGKFPFDVVVIDGSHRNECAKLAVDCVSPNGIIVFDNSDRRENNEGVKYICDNGWHRVDFFGLIPSYLYKGCTSIFFKNNDLVGNYSLPSQVKLSSGLTCAQAMGE